MPTETHILIRIFCSQNHTKEVFVYMSGNVRVKGNRLPSVTAPDSTNHVLFGSAI